MDEVILTPHIKLQSGCVALHLSFKPFEPSRLTLAGQEWLAKSELHCTLVSAKRVCSAIVQATGHSEAEAQTTLLGSIRNFLEHTQLEQADLKLTDDYRFVAKEDRRSIVRMVKLPSIEALFVQLRRDLNLQIPTQPTHITLFTGGDGRGIGINSNEELTDITKAMTADELAELKRLTNVDEVLA
jgi:hypothetical protein